MDSGEQLGYLFGFMDCYELFGLSKKNQTVGFKKAYILEKMFIAHFKTWTSDELKQKYDEYQGQKIPDKIVEFMQKQVDAEEMKALVDKGKIDWKFYLK